MHKNTLLFSSFLAVIAALLVGFNLGRNMSGDKPATVTPTPVTSPTPTVSYLSYSTCGVSFEYPDSLTPMQSSSSGVILTNTNNPETSVVVICQDEVPRVPLTPDKMEEMVVRQASGSASVSATLYHDASPKDGKPIDKFIFTHPKTGLDVFVAGFGPIFDRMITSLRLN
ncbi:MAG: hypothetical protein ACOY3M_02305 [Patescibacteria group bacterium]